MVAKSFGLLCTLIMPGVEAAGDCCAATRTERPNKNNPANHAGAQPNLRKMTICFSPFARVSGGWHCIQARTFSTVPLYWPLRRQSRRPKKRQGACRPGPG
jgi:hypothetical protein